MDLLAVSSQGKRLIGYGAGQRYWSVRREDASLVFQAGPTPERLRERWKAYASPSDAARAFESEVYRKMRDGLVDLGTGENLGDVRLHCRAPHGFRSDVLAYSDRLGILAVAVQDMKLREAQIHLVDVATGRMQQIASMPPLSLRDMPLIYSLAFSPDATKLAYTIDADLWHVGCYHMDSGETSQLAHPSAFGRVSLLRTLAWVPSGELVCVSGDDLVFIRPESGDIEQKIAIPMGEEHYECCYACLSPDAATLALAMRGRRPTSGPPQIRMYDTATGSLTNTLQPSLDDGSPFGAMAMQIEHARFSPDLRHLLLTVEPHRGPYVIDSATGLVAYAFTSSAGDQVQSCADMSFSPDGAWLAVAGYRQVFLYDYTLRQPIYQEHYGAHVGKIILSQDKRLLIYGGTSGEIVVRSTGLA